MNDKPGGAVTAKGRGALAEKTTMHPHNPHRGRYDFKRLITGSPELAAFVSLNKYGDEKIERTNRTQIERTGVELFLTKETDSDTFLKPQRGGCNQSRSGLSTE